MVGFELCSSLIRLRASSKISSSQPTGVHGLRSGRTSKSGSRPLLIVGSLPPGTTRRGYCGSSNPSGTFPDCARLKNRRMVQGSSVTPRCPSSAAIAGHVALSFRNRLISFRYGQSWLWNGFGWDVGFMVKSNADRAGRRHGHREEETERLYAKRAMRSVQRCNTSRCGEMDIPNGTRLHPSRLPPNAPRRPPFKGG
jgi:hypothetical protein